MDSILVTSYLHDPPDFTVSDFQSPQANNFDGSPHQPSPYDSFEFGQDSAQFPHTPSYNGSYQNSPFSTYSDLPPFDGPDDSIGIYSDSHSSAIAIPDEYDPTDFDVPTSAGILLDDNFMSGIPRQPHISVTPSFDQKSSSALFDHSSPASSNGAEDDSRSHASSNSSYMHPASPNMQSNSPHIDFAQNFESMRFESPNWAAGPLPQADRSSPPAHKAPSPPQLVIPASPSATGLDTPPIINAPDGDGGMPQGPQLHIVPATPISGGGGAAQSVPFQTTLANLHAGGSQGVQPSDTTASWEHQPQVQLGVSVQNAGLDSSQFADQSFSYPGSSNNHDASTSGMAFASETPLQLSSSPGHSQQFLFPQGMQRSRSLSDTSLRPPVWDTPMMNPLGHQGSSAGGDGNRLGSHDARRPSATVNLNDVLPGPSSPLLSPNLSQPSLSPQPALRHPSSAGPHTTTFGPIQPPRLSQHFTFGLPPGSSTAQDFLTPDAGMSLRRAKSDSIHTHRQVRSEDLRYSYSNPAAPSLSGMASASAGAGGMFFPPASSAQQDFIRATRQYLHPAAAAAEPVASITRGSHHRRASSGSRERPAGPGGWSSGASSARPSPYPSPSASPRPGYGALPPPDATIPMRHMDMLSISPGLPAIGNGSTDMPMTVSKVNVTTPSTADASQKRRKQPANFQCPVPGCGSTFTRHFNLKGHLRSHAEEKPFMCKWPGCGKGFARQHDCKRHEQLHLNIRPYPCEGCKKNFARMDALNRHLRSEGGAECRKIQDEITPASLAESMHDMSIPPQANLKPDPDGGWTPVNMGSVMM